MCGLEDVDGDMLELLPVLNPFCNHFDMLVQNMDRCDQQLCLGCFQCSRALVGHGICTEGDVD